MLRLAKLSLFFCKIPLYGWTPAGAWLHWVALFFLTSPVTNVIHIFIAQIVTLPQNVNNDFDPTWGDKLAIQNSSPKAMGKGGYLWTRS
jgi:hypothetical protein